MAPAQDTGNLLETMEESTNKNQETTQSKLTRMGGV